MAFKLVGVNTILYIFVSFLSLEYPLRSEAQAETDPVVVVPQGEILGQLFTFEDNLHLNVKKDYYVYRGIPFAEPPLGDLRFRAPVAKAGWDRVWNATYFRSACEQTNPGFSIFEVEATSEDCLYLNIYVPVSKPTKAAVMVWIHGGAFIGGAASSPTYEPYSLLAVNDFIFVSINYRLGAYGFLYTGDDSAPGNYGMLDQVEALKWIHNNIQAFGGDPEQVTVGGESAGAASTHLLAMSPLSQGLFHRAYLQSGSALNPWAVELEKEKSIAAAYGIADIVNCPVEGSTAALVDCLRDVSARDITTAMMNYLLSVLYNELPYAPIVDGYFLPDKPINLLRRKEFTPIDILLGSNADEGNLLALRAYPSYFFRDRPPSMSLAEFRETAPIYVYDYKSQMEFNAIEQEYIDWGKIDDPTTDYLSTFARFVTDQAFACPADVLARAYVSAGSNVYFYQMTHVPTTSFYQVVGSGPGWLGCVHAEDLQFVFGLEFNPAFTDRLDQTPEEIAMAKEVLKYWTNFVISGNPNSPQDSVFDPWPSYTLSELDYKVISLNLTNSKALKSDECAFWNKYMKRVSTFTDDLHDLQNEWEEEIQEWRQEDFLAWKTTFDEYKNGVNMEDNMK